MINNNVVYYTLMQMEDNYYLLLSVSKHCQRYIKGRELPKTHYAIELTTKFQDREKFWIIEKKYEEFKLLFSNLKKQIYQVPKIPSKKMFFIKSPDELNRIKEGLDMFMKECCLRKDIKNSPYFLEFIEILSQTDVVLKKVNLKHKFECSTHDICDIFHLKKNIFYVVLNNFNLVPSYNSKFSIIDKSSTDSHMITPGNLRAFSVSDLILKRFSSIDLSFETCVTSVYLSVSYLFIGLKSGSIYYIDLKIDSNESSDFQEIKAFKTNNVVGLGSTTDSVFVLSEKKLKVFSLSTKTLISGNSINLMLRAS